MNDFQLQIQILYAMRSISLPAKGSEILREFVKQTDNEVLISRLYSNIEFMEKMGWISSKVGKDDRYEFNLTDKGTAFLESSDTDEGKIPT